MENRLLYRRFSKSVSQRILTVSSCCSVPLLLSAVVRNHARTRFTSHSRAHVSFVTSLLCISFFHPTSEKKKKMLPPSSQRVFIVVIKNNSQECFHRAEEAERGTKRNTPPPPLPPSIQTRRTSPRLQHDGGGGRRRGALWFSKLSQWLRWCIWERCLKARIWLFTLFFFFFFGRFYANLHQAPGVN